MKNITPKEGEVVVAGQHVELVASAESGLGSRDGIFSLRRRGGLVLPRISPRAPYLLREGDD